MGDAVDGRHARGARSWRVESKAGKQGDREDGGWSRKNQTREIETKKTSFARPLNLAAMFFCASAQKHKIGNTDSHSGFFGPTNLRKEKKLSTFMN